LVAVVAFGCGSRLTADPLKTTPVGISGRVEGVVLPGPELEPTPYDDRRIPVVVRVLSVSPHGTAFRYDLEYYGLDPGTYDLSKYLRRKDGTPTTGLPSIPVSVTPVRPPGQVLPNDLTIDPGPRVGGYRTLLIILGVVWGVGLVGLIASFFFPRRKVVEPVVAKPLTLADRLRPLIDGATAGRLSQEELAALERALFAYWRRRLNLTHADPHQAMTRLQSDPAAGPLLAQLEAWLHHPDPKPPTDVGALLAPYREVPPDAVELPTTRGVSR
jgi:hypothetical protein